MDCECKMNKVFSRYPRKRESLLPILQDIQGNPGHLTPEAMDAAARHCRIHPVEAYATATFYAQFKFKPVGKKTLMVCQGTACHVMGGAQVLHEIKKQLGVEPGDTTEDGMFTLETVACIGACALAPTMVVDGDTLGTVKAQDIKEVLNAARQR
jgi:NADH:ubiquinone oxidoreductase subunit E